MKTGEAGINLIKSFEGLRLKAYKPVATEKYYTIGYGHYGADVKPDMVISNAYAEALLRLDLDKFERAVNSYERNWSQNQFDALVSFTFNCGVANLKRLVTNRTNAQIATAIVKYNKAGGKVLKGLVRRRKAEQELFMRN